MRPHAVLAMLLASCIVQADASRCLLRVLDGQRLYYCTSLSGEGAGKKVQVEITTPTTGWVGFGFRHQRDRTSGMAGADIVVVEPEDGGSLVVKDMYASENGAPRDDGCAPDWVVLSHSEADGERVVVLERSYNVTDTNRDRAIHPRTMQMIFAHGGAERRLAFHGTASNQYQWTIETQDDFYTAPLISFADHDVEPVCQTPAPPTEQPTTPEPATAEPTEAPQPTGPPRTEAPDATTTAAPHTQAEDSDDGLSDGAIAGIVVGAVFGVLLLAAVAWLLLRPVAPEAPNAPNAPEKDDEAGVQ